jgi:peptide/nickel transport system substrate-binding protein
MHEDGSYWRDRAARRVSRRAALRGGALGAGGMAAAFALACGGDDKPSGGQATTASGSPAAAATTGSGTAAAQATQPGEQPVRGGVIAQRLPTDPDHLDSHKSTTYGSVWPHAPCFNQLVQFNPDQKDPAPQTIVSDLAEKWEQPDAQTVVFTLKKGVKFHDGSPFTAEDAKVQLEWIRNPPMGKPSPRRVSAMGAVDAIEQVDDSTLRLKLKRPNPSLLMNLGSHYFTIGQAKDIVANGEIGPKLIGTGPFKLKTYEKGNFIEHERNPEYHVAGRPFLDGLKWFIVREYNTALTNLIGGQYHLFYELLFTPSQQKRLERESGGKYETPRVLSTLRDPVFMNATKPPYSDIRVRQAISLALDRDEAIDIVKEGAARKGGYMLPGGSWSISEADLKKFDGYDKPNIDRAKQLLKEAGVTTPLEAKGTTRTDFKPFAELAQNQLKKIGINLDITLADVATAQPVLINGQYDISPWLIAINVDDPDAVFGEISTSDAERNWSRVKDPEIDALYAKQTVTADINERKKIVQELEKRALSQYQIVAMYFEELTFARDKRVRNFTFHSSLYTNRRMEAVWLANS